jgi:hypothetical protein
MEREAPRINVDGMVLRKVRVLSEIGVLTLAAMAGPAWAAASDQRSWVDRDHFPEAYSILTSDRVMFPDDE